MYLTSFENYQGYKNEIIGKNEYTEHSRMESSLLGVNEIHKTYSTKDDEQFYEVTNTYTGITEFWSSKHSASRYIKC